MSLSLEVGQLLPEYLKVLLMRKPSPDCQTIFLWERDVVASKCNPGSLQKVWSRFSGNGQGGSVGSVLCQFNVVL